MKNKKNPFKEKIKIEMLKKGYTQTKMADLLGISNQAFSAWLNGGNPKIETLAKVAGLLGQPTNYFFENSGNIAENNSTINENSTTENLRLALIEKDVLLLKTEVELIKLKLQKKEQK